MNIYLQIQPIKLLYKLVITMTLRLILAGQLVEGLHHQMMVFGREEILKVLTIMEVILIPKMIYQMTVMIMHM